MTGFVTFLGWRLYWHKVTRRPRGQGRIRLCQIGKQWWWLRIGRRVWELWYVPARMG